MCSTWDRLVLHMSPETLVALDMDIEDILKLWYCLIFTIAKIRQPKWKTVQKKINVAAGQNCSSKKDKKIGTEKCDWDCVLIQMMSCVKTVRQGWFWAELRCEDE